MNGVEIEYLLGLYFLVVSMSKSGNQITFDWVKFVLALVFILAAVFGLTLIS